MTTTSGRHAGGVDPSLTSCGVSTLGSHESSGTAGVKGLTTLPLAQRATKLEELTDAVIRLLFGAPASIRSVSGWPALVLIEAPDVSRGYGGLVERIDLTCRITQRLVDRRVPVGWVPSPVIKGYATGKGGGKIGGVDVKQAVLQEAQRLWPELDIVNTDQADSAFLAAMAADLLGWGRVVPDDRVSKWLHHKSIQLPDGLQVGGSDAVVL